jgi:hypothetical protein
MQIHNLNTHKYKRFFAFGCSFTNYLWPTWADIIAHNIPNYENWGRGGAGNQFIFNSIIECNRRNKFNKDDLVIVMWTSCSREDRYVDNEWLVAATEGREKIYGKDWMKKFANQGKGLMIRDFATIDATQQLLDTYDCDWANLNSLPLIRFDINRAEKDIKKGTATLEDLEERWALQQSMLSQGTDHWDTYLADIEVVNLYKNIFPNIKEPLFNIILKNKQRPNFGDKHPTPSESFDYINSVLPNNLEVTDFVKYWDCQVDNITVKDKMPITFARNNIKRF